MSDTTPYCAKLRSKKFYFLEGPARTEDELLDASNDCWCQVTQQRVGPDQEPVDPEACTEGRACFEPA